MKKIQLSIPEPCHQNWNDMTPTQQGRFCNACAKEVIDFSEMSDSEVLNYFIAVKKNDTVCGRVFPDQLDRSINAAPKKKVWWYWNYAVAFLLLFFKPNYSKAQSLPQLGAMVSFSPALPTDIVTNSRIDKNEKIKKCIINGQIMNEAGEPVQFASVKLISAATGTSADVDGRFTLDVHRLNTMIEVSAIGYEPQQLTITNLADKQIQLKKSSELMTDITINTVGYIKCRRMISGAMYAVSSTELKRNNTMDSINNWLSSQSIKIYPNPVPKGNLVNIVLVVKQTGQYTLQLTDASGRLITQKKISVLAKQQTEQLQSSSNWSAGIYYLRLFDKNGRFAGISTLQVQ